MKKIILGSTVALALAAGAFSVYADSPEATNNEFEDRYEYMNENRPSQRNSHRFNPDFTEEERQEWVDEMQAERSAYREERISAGIQEGTLTEEEAAEWRAHFEESDRLHRENRFSERGFSNHGHGMRRNNRHMHGGCHY